MSSLMLKVSYLYTELTRQEEQPMTVEELIQVLQQAPNPQAEVRVWSEEQEVSFPIEHVDLTPRENRVDIEFQHII